MDHEAQVNTSYAKPRIGFVGTWDIVQKNKRGKLSPSDTWPKVRFKIDRWGGFYYLWDNDRYLMEGRYYSLEAAVLAADCWLHSPLYKLAELAAEF